MGFPNRLAIGSQKIPAILAAALLAVAASQAGEPPAFLKAYVGPDGLVHLVDGTRHDRTMAKETDQRAVSVPKVSADGRTAGWLVEEDNCCTTYPIATRLVLQNTRTRHVISNGFMLYDWCFADNTKVAVASGTVHNMTREILGLYAAASGILLRQARRSLNSDRPKWARCLRPPA